MNTKQLYNARVAAIDAEIKAKTAELDNLYLRRRRAFDYLRKQSKGRITFEYFTTYVNSHSTHTISAEIITDWYTEFLLFSKAYNQYFKTNKHYTTALRSVGLFNEITKAQQAAVIHRFKRFLTMGFKACINQNIMGVKKPRNKAV